MVKKGEKGKWKGTKTPWGDRTEEKKPTSSGQRMNSVWLWFR